jgi:hypothetical protein
MTQFLCLSVSRTKTRKSNKSNNLYHSSSFFLLSPSSSLFSPFSFSSALPSHRHSNISNPLLCFAFFLSFLFSFFSFHFLFFRFFFALRSLLFFHLSIVLCVCLAANEFIERQISHQTTITQLVRSCQSVGWLVWLDSVLSLLFAEKSADFSHFKLKASNYPLTSYFRPAKRFFNFFSAFSRSLSFIACHLARVFVKN